jgi:hypothetical protein
LALGLLGENWNSSGSGRILGRVLKVFENFEKFHKSWEKFLKVFGTLPDPEGY